MNLRLTMGYVHILIQCKKSARNGKRNNKSAICAFEIKNIKICIFEGR